DFASAKPQAAEAVDEDVAGSEVGPVLSAEGREFGTIVARCVGRLPARQREVLVLTSYEGMSAADVAGVLGISEQNVRTTLHLARERMRAQLARYMRETTRER